MDRIATSLPYTEKPVAEGNYGTNRTTIDRIVIHTMVGTAAGASARFNNPTQQVSAHYGVKLDGSLIHWLEEYIVAYHAGNMAMNQRSIGIEHEDNGDYNGPRTNELYATSAKLVKDICDYYNIPIDRQHIIKHSEVIATGCPDALDIDRIVREAGGADTSTVAVPKETFERLVTKSSLFDKFDDAGFSNPQEVIDKIATQMMENNKLSTQINSLNKQLTDAETERNMWKGKYTDLLNSTLASYPTVPQEGSYKEFKLFGIRFWVFT